MEFSAIIYKIFVD